MSGHNLKDFLESGAFLQTGPDSFKVLIGPFKQQSQLSTSSVLLYKPKFWSFLDVPAEQNYVYECASVFNLNRVELMSWLKSSSSVSAQIKWEEPDRDGFAEQFNWSQQQFSGHQLIKTVPIIAQSGEGVFGAEQLNRCLQSLVENQSFGWSYGFFENKCGFLGRSPELIGKWQIGKVFQTVALAGTVAQGPGAAENLLSDIKIREEHRLVVEDIQTQIRELGWEARISDAAVLQLPLLLHLRTEMSCDINNREQALQLIEKLHPTAAMGIYPRNLSRMRTFSEFKLQQQRGDFATPFVMIEQDEVFGVVAIRNLYFSGNKQKIFSGCGVTAMSDFSSEMAELKSKRQSVKKILGLSFDE